MLGYLLLISFLGLCWLGEQVQPTNRKLYKLSFCLFFILFVGVRHEVGTDYNSYKEIFDNHYELAEFGYNKISQMVHHIGGGFTILMLVCAFINISSLHYVFSRYKYYFISFLLFIIMSGGYSFMVNGIRQALAIGFFLIAVHYINNLKKYLLFIILASCFHLSSIVLLPFYWVCKMNFNSRLAFKVILLLLIFSKIINYSQVFIPLIQYTIYGKYLEIITSLNTETGTGLGFLFINIIGLIVLYKGDYLLKKHPEIKNFMWMFFCFFFTRILFENISVLLRIALYFDYSLYIIIPYFLASCISKKNNVGLFYSLVVLLLVLFAKSVIGDTFMLEYKSVLSII